MTNKKSITFIDFFAGAGGFSEGFLQAETKNSQYDFLLASDINENSEVTHVMRYKHQLGLKDNKFLCKDITDEDFIHQLKSQLGNNEIDVITGGPPCQSFSLAGRRRTFDKKDDLFRNYLNVVRELQPKYFVMENVKGILTKYDGAVVERIKREVSEILDRTAVKNLQESLAGFINTTKALDADELNILKHVSILIGLLSKGNDDRSSDIQLYFKSLLSEFTNNVPKFLKYRESKTNENIATVRHGLKMLVNAASWNRISRDVMKAKSEADIDNDSFVKEIDSFLKFIEPENIINEIVIALSKIEHKGHLSQLSQLISLYQYSIEEYLEIISSSTSKDQSNDYYYAISTQIHEGINLYNLNDPMVLLASDYGVPQNRERVIFLGCRKDQKFIDQITKTTPSVEDKVTIFEALNDLDNIGINEVVKEYLPPLKSAENFNKSNAPLVKERCPQGTFSGKMKKTFAEWSREGRLNPERFPINGAPFCINYNDYTNQNELDHLKVDVSPLHNHQTSNHSEEVQNRLAIIRKHGDYKKASEELYKTGLASKKRNYTPFIPHEQSTTIMTIADDYVHYRADRAPTVREMARLQSFDDSFVFQGKRTTGGDRRKSEIPQFTLVGNAVPPLMARAIAQEILNNIE